MSHQFQASSTAKDFDKVHPYFAPAQKAVSTWREIHLCSSLGAALPSCASETADKDKFARALPFCTPSILTQVVQVVAPSNKLCPRRTPSSKTLSAWIP